MRLFLKVHPEASLLSVVATGKFTLIEAKRTFIQILEAVALHKTSKVLIDGLQVTGKPETMERFYYGEFAASTVRDYRERGVSPSTQFAYLLKKPVCDPMRFGEVVAVNRGMFVKVFENSALLYKWLRVDPPTNQI